MGVTLVEYLHRPGATIWLPMFRWPSRAVVALYFTTIIATPCDGTIAEYSPVVASRSL
jgi:hypothetical protein